ncbi:MAG: hypothetical protein ACRDJM_01515, partial [Actinomycetota bacterium]
MNGQSGHQSKDGYGGSASNRQASAHRESPKDVHQVDRFFDVCDESPLLGAGRIREALDRVDLLVGYHAEPFA